MKSSFSCGWVNIIVVLFWTCSLAFIITVDSIVNPLTPFPSKWANAFAGSFSGIIPNKLPSCSDYWGKTSPVCNLSKFPRVLFSFGKDSHMLRKTTWKVLHWRLGWSPVSFHTWFSYVVSTSWFLHLLIPNHSASLLPQALSSSLWNQQSRYIRQRRSHVHTPGTSCLLLLKLLNKTKQIFPAKWKYNKDFLFGFPMGGGGNLKMSPTELWSHILQYRLDHSSQNFNKRILWSCLECLSPSVTWESFMILPQLNISGGNFTSFNLKEMNKSMKN